MTMVEAGNSSGRADRPRAPPAARRPPFVAPPELVGRWNGTIHTYKGDIPVALEFLSSGEFVRVRVARDPATAMVNPALARAADGEGYVLDGEFHGDLATPDVDRIHPYIVRIRLDVRGDAMSGVARTYYYDAQNGNYLPHWASFTKAP